MGASALGRDERSLPDRLRRGPVRPPLIRRTGPLSRPTSRTLEDRRRPLVDLALQGPELTESRHGRLEIIGANKRFSRLLIRVAEDDEIPTLIAVEVSVVHGYDARVRPEAPSCLGEHTLELILLAGLGAPEIHHHVACVE